MKRSQDAWQTTLSTGPGPSFCSGCGKLPPQGPGVQACPSCGDRLILQGFCPVCECYLRLPVGSACPKHDLPLEARAPVRPQLDDAGKPLKWVTVGQFSDSMAAEPPRIRLEAEGIPTFVEGERMGSRSMYHVATGGSEAQSARHPGDRRCASSSARPGRRLRRNLTSRRAPTKTSTSPSGD